MANRGKQFVLRNNHYCGELDEIKEAQILETIESDCIPKLKHMIYDFPMWLIEDADANGMRVLDYLKVAGLDAKDFVGELRDKQTIGAGFMYLSHHSILGDGVGLGKTVEVSALFNMLRMTKQMSKAIFIADNDGITQAIRELKRFTGMKVVEIPSLTNKLDKVIESTNWNDVEILVGKHSLLTNDRFMNWIAQHAVRGPKKSLSNKLYDTFVLDESYLLRNPKTVTCTYVKKLCEMATRVHFLNATVFETHILDIYNQFDIMGKHIMPTKGSIEAEFCNVREETYWRKARFKGDINTGKKSVIDGYRNESVFKERLKLIYLARTSKEMGLESNNQYYTVEIDPTETQLKLMRKGYRYNEVLNDPSLVDGAGITTSIEHVPKIYKAVNLSTQDFATSNILIYCFHKNAQKVIKEELIKQGRTAEIINSDVKEKERNSIVDRFNRKELDVLITNGKRSRNLYGGDVCIMYSIESNPAQMEQIRGRIDRHVDDSAKVFVLMYYAFTPEYDLFNSASKRSESARNLTVDAQSAVDMFMQALEEGNIL